ncbi:MAG TPA: Sec-independent protein translocase protein TatB [Acidimicrobiales bacterium]|nr:Sec-independent protein translocase protein TatB [Acidimicrobiales bacterium]
MFNVGGGELLVILLLALIVLGPQRLPGAVRTAGRVMGEVKRISSGFQTELKTAFDEADIDDEPPRRREAVPLASAVAELDAGDHVPRDDAAGTTDDDGTDRGTGTTDDVTDHVTGTGTTDDGTDGAGPPAGRDTTLAPAVADALDEIVTPLSAPATEPSEPPAGGERAAS